MISNLHGFIRESKFSFLQFIFVSQLFYCLKLHTYCNNWLHFFLKKKFKLSFKLTFHILFPLIISSSNYYIMVRGKHLFSPYRWGDPVWQWLKFSFVIRLEHLSLHRTKDWTQAFWCEASFFFYHFKLSPCYAKSTHIFGETSHFDIHFQCFLQSSEETVGIMATVPSVMSVIETIDVSLERSQREGGGLFGSPPDGESIP